MQQRVPARVGIQRLQIPVLRSQEMLGSREARAFSSAAKAPVLLAQAGTEPRNGMLQIGQVAVGPGNLLQLGPVIPGHRALAARDGQEA